jgi:glucosamine--fructose-6-phosphate aminotransferase (isomerizing)
LAVAFSSSSFSSLREQLAMSQVRGTYGIAVLSLEQPDIIVAARHGAPLIVGLGDGENLIASDVSAMLEHTKRVVYLGEGEVVTVSRDGIQISTIDNLPVSPKYQDIEWDLEQLEKGGFAHFMLKEIYEQPATIRNAIRGRLNYDAGTSRLNGLKLQAEELLHVKRIIITACGTSWHAAMIGEYMIEDLARIPVEVVYASEFRYRSPIVDQGTLVFVICQSGETADTLAAGHGRFAVGRGAPCTVTPTRAAVSCAAVSSFRTIGPPPSSPTDPRGVASDDSDTRSSSTIRSGLISRASRARPRPR